MSYKMQYNYYMICGKVLILHDIIIAFSLFVSFFIINNGLEFLGLVSSFYLSLWSCFLYVFYLLDFLWQDHNAKEGRNNIVPRQRSSGVIISSINGFCYFIYCVILCAVAWKVWQWGRKESRKGPKWTELVNGTVNRTGLIISFGSFH